MNEKAFSWIQINWKPLTLTILLIKTSFILSSLFMIADEIEELLQSGQEVAFIVKVVFMFSQFVNRYSHLVIFLIGVIHIILIWYFFGPLNQKMKNKLGLFFVWALGVEAVFILTTVSVTFVLYYPLF